MNKSKQLIQNSYKCVDCDKHMSPYMVKNEVWHKAWSTYRAYLDSIKCPGLRHGNLCIKCLAKRLRRPLTIDDFTDVPSNELAFYFAKDNTQD